MFEWEDPAFSYFIQLRHIDCAMYTSPSYLGSVGWDNPTFSYVMQPSHTLPCMHYAILPYIMSGRKKDGGREGGPSARWVGPILAPSVYHTVWYGIHCVYHPSQCIPLASVYHTIPSRRLLRPHSIVPSHGVVFYMASPPPILVVSYHWRGMVLTSYGIIPLVWYCMYLIV